MTPRLQRWMARVLVVCAMAPLWALAQTPPSGPGMAPPPTQLPQDQLDSLLAPIALYPDQLLSQVLMASTYPLEVVEAARFVQQNPGLKGEALDQALGTKTWDPSVMSLAAFPQVLVMMNDKLEWTQQLGDAFLANEGQVMQTVQSLRAQGAGRGQPAEHSAAKGDRAGTGRSSSSRRSRRWSTCRSTTRPIIYGPWWVPAYRPWYWYPPPIYGYPPMGSGVRRRVRLGQRVGGLERITGAGRTRTGVVATSTSTSPTIISTTGPQYQNRYQNGNWQHLPEHRKGVAYRDTSVQNRYLNTNSAAVQSREAYRGREVTRPHIPGSPAPRPAPGYDGSPRNRHGRATRRTPDDHATAERRHRL